MMEFPSLVDKAVKRILELSADLQIKRRTTPKYSFEHHDYGVAIAAYGEVLEVLTTLQQHDEYSPSLGLLGSLESEPGPRAVL
ncbi:MAG TPA: hypothetical protein VIH67_09900 [Candidatus Acidoferrum sp.]